MYKFLTVLFLGIICNISMVLAHPGGHGESLPIDETEVVSTASGHMTQLIEQGVDLKGIGKLNENWKDVPESGKSMTKKPSGYYVVSFTHPKEKRTLYLLISPAGDLYDVNLSGIFEGL